MSHSVSVGVSVRKHNQQRWITENVESSRDSRSIQPVQSLCVFERSLDISVTVLPILNSIKEKMTKNETVMLAGGSSISGVFVSCYSSLESCLQSCYMSCYIADFCNDKPGDVVACAPALTSMIILTLIFVISLCGCCCMICFCSPCCFCAVWWRKRRARRNRGRADFTTYPSAPPLLSKA
ncbi:unnamed protein product [Cylicocyclus nassatus]|uniref:Uncharacterized protein n=1 Tax=Cylicocyclus nassatus TaxID=53992 RepID=A0AA36HFF2_CYLNA|nr:unnamed protein product [Cylicocyclus nassatus]